MYALFMATSRNRGPIVCIPFEDKRYDVSQFYIFRAISTIMRMRIIIALTTGCIFSSFLRTLKRAIVMTKQAIFRDTKMLNNYEIAKAAVRMTANTEYC